MMLIGDENRITFKCAVPEDADIVARIHAEAWQQAYEDIVDKSYLESQSVAERKSEFLNKMYSEGIRYDVFYRNQEPAGVGVIETGCFSVDT